MNDRRANAITSWIFVGVTLAFLSLATLIARPSRIDQVAVFLGLFAAGWAARSSIPERAPGD